MEPGCTRAQLVGRVGLGVAGFLLSGCSGRGAAPVAPTAPAPPARRPAATGKVRRFHSRPDLVPPTISVLENRGGTAPGYLFLAPSSGPGQRGALIVDDAGEPVWFHPTGETVMNLRAAVYRGQPVLTWWQGKTEHGLGEGTHVVFDSSYRELMRFPAGRGRPSDLHELIVTPKGTALVTAWELAQRPLSAHGGRRRHPVIGGVVQELALPGGRVLFEWRSLEHVGLEESHQRVGPRFDYFHVNSIDVAPDGNLIVCARNTWAVYKVSRRTGEVLWRLGGKKSDFRMGRGTRFAWQHDARSLGDGGRLSLFDDGAAPQVERQSRGLVLALDLERMRATLVRQYVHRPRPLLAHFLGSTQVLANGNVLVGWGSAPNFTEFAEDGAILYDAKLPRGGQDYRALRFPWTGRPAEPPRVALRGASLYASWNGSTELASWQLRAGAAPDGLRSAATVPAAGFETALPVPPGTRYAAATALDRAGAPLRSSATVAA